MTEINRLPLKLTSQVALDQFADWLALGVAVSLPWSTSATGILIFVWLIVALPMLGQLKMRCAVLSAAGGVPILLVALAASGVLWADVSWSERLGGLEGFYRLLMIPLLLAWFRRSPFGMRVIGGFVWSVAGVLLFSWVLVLFPGLPWHANFPGVPVKDYIVQSENFLICAFVLLGAAVECDRLSGWVRVGAVGCSVLFLCNIAFVATGRTTLLIFPVLLFLFGWRYFGWKGFAVAGMVGGLAAAVAWDFSPYLRERLDVSVEDLHAYLANDAPNSTAFHLEFLRKSISFIEAAPIFGHGTGSIAEQFRSTAISDGGAASVVSINPHNQLFVVAIQLGLIGGGLLVAMWLAHFMFFRGSGLIAWIGTIFVAENVVGSLFNSHLFDFTQGWIYVFGVGVAAGAVLRELDFRRVSRLGEGFKGGGSEHAIRASDQPTERRCQR